MLLLLEIKPPMLWLRLLLLLLFWFDMIGVVLFWNLRLTKLIKLRHLSHCDTNCDTSIMQWIYLYVLLLSVKLLQYVFAIRWQQTAHNRSRCAICDSLNQCLKLTLTLDFINQQWHLTTVVILDDWPQTLDRVELTWVYRHPNRDEVILHQLFRLFAVMGAVIIQNEVWFDVWR